MKYILRTTDPDDEIEMVHVIQEMKLKGIMWPNQEDGKPQFELDLTEEELLIVKLRVACVQH